MTYIQDWSSLFLSLDEMVKSASATVQSPSPFLAIWDHELGEKVPIVIDTGDYDLGIPLVIKRFRKIELDGHGFASVMVFSDGQFLAQGHVSMTKQASRESVLSLPRGSKGVKIRIIVVFNGVFDGFNIEFDPQEGALNA